MSQANLEEKVFHAEETAVGSPLQGKAEEFPGKKSWAPGQRTVHMRQVFWKAFPAYCKPLNKSCVLGTSSVAEQEVKETTKMKASNENVNLFTTDLVCVLAPMGNEDTDLGSLGQNPFFLMLLLSAHSLRTL